jgi:hypothetical protein
MVIKDGVQSARVLMKDYGFSVPMDSRGKKAKVEGILTSRTFTEAQVKHLEQDAGKDPKEVAGERTEHVLTATGIEIASWRPPTAPSSSPGRRRGSDSSSRVVWPPRLRASCSWHAESSGSRSSPTS